MSNSTELLYHVFLKLIDFRLDLSGPNDPSIFLAHDFIEYAVHSSHTGDWAYGNGVLVYAKAPAGQVFKISIQATSNTEQLLGDSDGSPYYPKEHLRFTTSNWLRAGDADRGTFVHRTDASNAARKLLDPLDYAEYDTPEKMKEEWPYGDDVVAHAVAETGENTTVEVKTVVDTHYKYEKVV
ncbi:hypothetical protein SNK05_013601 [Fusarium graminearum]